MRINRAGQVEVARAVVKPGLVLRQQRCGRGIPAPDGMLIRQLDGRIVTPGIQFERFREGFSGPDRTLSRLLHQPAQEIAFRMRVIPPEQLTGTSPDDVPLPQLDGTPAGGTDPLEFVDVSLVFPGTTSVTRQRAGGYA